MFSLTRTHKNIKVLIEEQITVLSIEIRTQIKRYVTCLRNYSNKVTGVNIFYAFSCLRRM